MVEKTAVHRGNSQTPGENSSTERKRSNFCKHLVNVSYELKSSWAHVKNLYLLCKRIAACIDNGYITLSIFEGIIKNEILVEPILLLWAIVANGLASINILYFNKIFKLLHFVWAVQFSYCLPLNIFVSINCYLKYYESIIVCEVPIFLIFEDQLNHIFKKF